MAIFLKKRVHSKRFGAVTWIYIGSSLALGFLIPRVNQWLFPELISPLEKSTLATILASIASGMITLTGIVFSLVFVIVQFGSTTYSPRITRLFANVRVLRHALGIFTGTFLYCLMALRTTGIEQTVSAFTVWVAFLWLLASVVVLTELVYVFTTLTIGAVLYSLSRTGRHSIARLYGPYVEKNEAARHHRGAGQTPGIQAKQRVIYEGLTAYVVGYDTASLVSLAHAADAVIHLPYEVGEAVQDGQPVALIYDANRPIEEKRIHGSITLAHERVFRNDPKYALRLLVDTAIRGLSPAINDPTTAVHALDHIETLLWRLGNAELDIGQVRDRQGKIRVVYPTPGWDDFMQLSLCEIMQYGATSLQVQRRLEALLRFLKQSVPTSRVPVIERFAAQRCAMASGAFNETMFREWANVPDREGLGGAK